MPKPDLASYIDAVPINAITAGGFGPLRRRLPWGTGAQALAELRRSPDGTRLALETIGITAIRVLVVVIALGGTATADDFAAQTASANPAELAAALERLVAAGLVHVDAHGTVTIDPRTEDFATYDIRSLGAPQAVTNEDLAFFCRNLSIITPKLKGERVEAIAAAFATEPTRGFVRNNLSAAALDLLDAIADIVILSPAPAADLGLGAWDLRTTRYHDRYGDSANPRVRALHELANRGIVGADPNNGLVWIWREAWPLLDRPFVARWDVAERPPIVAQRADDTAATPSIVSLLDALLQRWRDLPPAVLKNDEPRISRIEARAIARALQSDEATIDLLARLAISLRLVVRDEVARSGRGRNQRIEQAWRPDPDLTGAWATKTAHHRWGRLVAEWCAPRVGSSQLLTVRHLTLWELQQLDDGSAYRGDAAFVVWMANRYAPIATTDTVAECIVDLRALGIITDDVLALTERGHAILTDPNGAVDANLGESTRGFVQGDLTVIAPPDLRHDLVQLLERIATVQSRGGAIHRLDANRITKAVQAGDTADDILDRLRELAGADLPDTVTRLVQDAAARAGAVQLISAATVIIVDDPADLTVACAIKALALSRLGPTIAATDVAVAKVQAALEAKGISPKLVTVEKPPSKRAREQQARQQELIDRLREAAEHHGGDSFFAREADRLAATAKADADLDARLALPAALTLTPAAAAALVAEATRRG